MEEVKDDSENEERQTFSIRVKKYIKNLLDFSHYDRKTIFYIILFIGLIIVSLVLLYLLIFVDNTILYLFVIKYFVNPIYDLGVGGIFLFIAIMGLQGLIIPLPSELVLLSAGIIWGWLYGGLMGVVGSMAAALLCYYISRRGGRPLAEKFVGKRAINLADDFIHKYGIFAIIIARFLPFIAFDPISYAAGLVDLDTKRYSVGTLIGSFPRAFFYSFLGASLGIQPPIKPPYPNIEAQSALFNNVFLIIFAVLIVMFVAYYLTARYYEKKKLGKSNPNH